MISRDRARGALVSHVRRAAAAPKAEAPGARSGNGWRTARLARGSAAAMLIYVAGAGLTYCAQLVVARAIGADGYGVYAYVLAWVTVLAYVAALGFDVSLLRFVPAYLARHAADLVRGVIRYAMLRVAAVGCCMTLAGVAFVLGQPGKLSPLLAHTFLVGFALVPIVALLWICAAIVRGFGGVISALAPDRMIRDGVLVALVLLVGVGAGWRIDAASAMAATLLGSATGLGIVILAMRRLRPAALDRVAPTYEAQRWRRTALPLVIIRAAEALMNRTGVLLLAWIVDAKSAGVYAVAFNIAFAITLPRTAVNALLAPEISDLFVRGDRAALRSIVAKAASWTLFGAVAIALPVAVFAGPLLGLFGRDFEAGAPVLRILIVGQVAAAAAGSQLHLLNMTGRERSAAALLVASAASNAAVGAALVSGLGGIGAALAATAALIGWNAAMAVAVRRHLGLWPGILAAWPREAVPPTQARSAIGD